MRENCTPGSGWGAWGDPCPYRDAATRCRINECIYWRCIIQRILSMFLLIPTWACYRRSDDGVRSPADNVPNRVEMETGRPFWETSPVKG